MQNNDLISRSALIEAFKDFFNAPIRKEPQEQYTLDYILMVINDAPTAFHEPIYDALWMDNADSYMCSRCHYECSNPNALLKGALVCPRCYAIMATKPEREADL